MPFIAAYDAAALYPNAQRDLLIRLAQQGLFQAKWTDHILDEVRRARLRRNLKDFPAGRLTEWNIEAKSPDDFVLDQISIDDRIVFSCVQEIANSRRKAPRTTADILAEHENNGLVASVAALRTPSS